MTHSPHLPIDQQHIDDDIPDIPLDENGEPIIDEDSDEDMFDYADER